MAAKRTGISRELIIHPGETLAEVLEERNISQADLAARTGVSAVFVSNVINGKKDISGNFANALEYALGVPKSFWMNLQVKYDVELMEFNELQTITDEERRARESLKEIVKYLRDKGEMEVSEKKEESILSLRKKLMVSNLVNVRELIPAMAIRNGSDSAYNRDVLGAWIRLCQMEGENKTVSGVFHSCNTEQLVNKIKMIMLNDKADKREELELIFAENGIVFSLVKHFQGAPVQGYVAQKKDNTYQMAVTLRNAYAENFWFSILHELGHIVNGDAGKTRFVDDGMSFEKETAADEFAKNALLSKIDYQVFLKEGDFSLEGIKRFAASQNVKPYIVIGRLQRDERMEYQRFSRYKEIYKWLEI